MKVSKLEDEDFLLDNYLPDNLHIVGKSFTLDKRGWKEWFYILECEKCSKDKELWPLGSISIRKGCIVKGQSSCGCSKRFYWSEEQYKVLINRRAKLNGHAFLGFSTTDKISRNTKLILEDSEGKVWESTSIGKYLGGSKDTLKNFKFSNDYQHIEDFYNTGKFPEGTIFCRDTLNKDADGYFNNWLYKCPNCAKDKFAIGGVCNGIFSKPSSELKEGKKSCRCADRYIKSPEQKKFEVVGILGTMAISWNGWKDYCKTFTVVCPKGHITEKEVRSFIHKPSGCGVCYKNKPNKMFNGYDPDRKEDEDLLYVIKFKDKYIKCGRAFVIENRLKGASGLLKKSGCTRDQLEILHVYTGTHQEVYDTEQFVIDELTERGFYYKTWTRETFSLDSEKLMIDLIQNHSTLTKIEYIEGM